MLLPVPSPTKSRCAGDQSPQASDDLLGRSGREKHSFCQTRVNICPQYYGFQFAYHSPMTISNIENKQRFRVTFGHSNFLYGKWSQVTTESLRTASMSITCNLQVKRCVIIIAHSIIKNFNAQRENGDKQGYRILWHYIPNLQINWTFSFHRSVKSGAIYGELPKKSHGTHTQFIGKLACRTTN
jgi:hypothetical protein